MFRAFLLIISALFLASSLAQLGVCDDGEDEPECFVDISFSGEDEDVFGADDEDEVFYLQKIDFDEEGINFVTAIEQSYNANCDCDQEDAFECTGGIAEVFLYTSEEEPEVAGWTTELDLDGLSIAAVLLPSEKMISFNYTEEGSSLRFGGETTKGWGLIVIRVLPTTSDFGLASVDGLLRFITLCEDEAEDASNFVGYLEGKVDAKPLAAGVDVEQTRVGVIIPPVFESLLEVEGVDEITLHSVGIYGREWLTSATLYVVDSEGYKTEVASWGEDDSMWYTAALEELEEEVTLSEGDFLQWECNFDSTSDEEDAEEIEAGDAFTDYACNVRAIFSNSRCGGVTLSNSDKEAPNCEDELPVFEEVEPEPEQEFLVYDYDPRHGICSDGSQWDKHPYRCTDQFEGGTCAYCAGRANDRESRTCINRDGMTCDEIFNSMERKTWCNMEFECPASTSTISFVVMFLAIILALY